MQLNSDYIFMDLARTNTSIQNSIIIELAQLYY